MFFFNNSSAARNIDSSRNGSTVAVRERRPTEVSGELESYSIIDVREPWEYEQGRLPGSKLIPLASLPAAIDGLDRDASYLMTCQSGSRSGIAARMLAARGFTDVSNLSGGMMFWQRSRLPVERS